MNEDRPIEGKDSTPQTVENVNPVRTFEEFKELYTNNFFMFFVGGNTAADEWGNSYRKQPTYVQCLADHPELGVITAELRRIYDERYIAPQEASIEELKREISSFYNAPGYLENLYQAYLLMRNYVPRDGELFR